MPAGTASRIATDMELAEMNEAMLKESEKYGEDFAEIPKEHWAHKWTNDETVNRFKILRSKDFFVQLFRQGAGVIRITVNRTQLKAPGRWVDGITWDELQKIKSQLGYGHRDAVEVYPKDKDVVNVANMRHLWILPDPLGFIWRNDV